MPDSYGMWCDYNDTYIHMPGNYRILQQRPIYILIMLTSHSGVSSPLSLRSRCYHSDSKV